MATPANDSYACASGGTINAGRHGRPAWVLARTVGVPEEILGTALSAAGVAFVWPGGLRPGGEDKSIVDGWGGWAKWRDRVKLTGTGHVDGNYNPFYDLIISGPVPYWVRSLDPTPYAQTVAYLNNEVGNCAHWNDDGRPTGAHVYWAMHVIGDKLIRTHGFNYDGITKTGYQSFAPNNEAWTPVFDLVANAWDAPNSHALMPNWGIDAKGDGSIAFAPCCTDGTYFYAHLLNKALGRYCLCKYDPVADVWTGGPDIGPYIIPKTAGGQDTYPASVYDSTRHELVVICEGTEQTVRRYNLNTGLVTVTARTGISMGATWSSSYSGACYDSKRDLFYVYSGKADTDKYFYVIDPKDNYKVSIMPGTGTLSVTVTTSGLNSRFMYIPEYDGILFQPAYNQNLIFLRLS